MKWRSRQSTPDPSTIKRGTSDMVIKPADSDHMGYLNCKWRVLCHQKADIPPRCCTPGESTMVVGPTPVDLGLESRRPGPTPKVGEMCRLQSEDFGGSSRATPPAHRSFAVRPSTKHG